MDDLKKEGALIQLDLFNKLFEVFNSEKNVLFIKKLGDSELKDDPFVKGIKEEMDAIKGVYSTSNKLPKWAPVHIASLSVIVGHMLNYLRILTAFSESSRGKEKS